MRSKVFKRKCMTGKKELVEERLRAEEKINEKVKKKKAFHRSISAVLSLATHYSCFLIRIFLSPFTRFYPSSKRRCRPTWVH